MRIRRFVAPCVPIAALSWSACSREPVPAPSPAEASPGAEAGVAPGATQDGPIAADPAKDCPPGFDSPAKPPLPGENAGFEVAGQPRRFQLLVPPASFEGPRPILFAFHGTTENGAKFIARARLAELVERGFVVVAPDAVGNGSIWPVWDAMRAPGTEGRPNADLALFDRLLACTAAHFSIDRRRVFATGHSAGGIFTNRLLRSRSNVLAGGIVASGVFDLTAPAPMTPLEPMLAVVTWGGDNDAYRGTTPNGVSVPAFSFVEQASLASRFYDAEPAVAQVRCRGNDIGHAWLPLNAWFADLLLAHPKGTASSSFALPAPPAGVACGVDAYVLPPLPDMTCPATARVGCTEACQLFADCAVENRTVGPSFAGELSKVGFTTTSCAGCVQRCESGATAPADAQVLACLRAKQAAVACGPGIEGAAPLFEGVNTCCADQGASNLCVDLCTALNASSAAAAFFPVCQQIAP